MLNKLVGQGETAIFDLRSESKISTVLNSLLETGKQMQPVGATIWQRIYISANKFSSAKFGTGIAYTNRIERLRSTLV